MKLSLASFALAAWLAPTLLAQTVLGPGDISADLDFNGSTDITFVYLADCPSGGFLQAAPTGGGVASYTVGSTAFAGNLPINSTVGPALTFTPTAMLMTCGLDGTLGPWGGRGVDAYMGATINIAGQPHYAWLLVRHHTSGAFALVDWWVHPTANTSITVGDRPGLPPNCGSADFNRDGDVGTDADIEDFFHCIAGNCCLFCGTADFNGDGDVGTDADIEAFFRVLAGGC